MTDWVDEQLVRRGIHDERVLGAMRRVPRELFVPDPRLAYADEALRIGHGQTISQPFIVALICQALELRGAERVLDVGTGSGYQAAVLSELTRDVVSIERIPELAGAARDRLAAAGYEVEVVVGNGRAGVPERAPFGGIAVAAAADAVPPALLEQLTDDGRLVIPLGDRLAAVDRAGQARTLTDARFVPLVD